MDDSPRGSVTFEKGKSPSTLRQSRESATVNESVGFKGLPSRDNSELKGASALRQQSSLSPTTLKQINDKLILNADI